MGDANFHSFDGIIDTEALKTPGSGIDIGAGPGVVSLEDYVAATERHFHHALEGAEPEPVVKGEEHLPQGVTETDEELKHHWYVGSIDQGTTSSRFIIFSGEGDPVASHQIEFENLYPKSGWHEHEPLELLA